MTPFASSGTARMASRFAVPAGISISFSLSCISNDVPFCINTLLRDEPEQDRCRDANHTNCSPAYPGCGRNVARCDQRSKDEKGRRGVGEKGSGETASKPYHFSFSPLHHCSLFPT